MKKFSMFAGLSLPCRKTSVCFRVSVKYGSIVTDMKGSVGGHTYKGTAAGGVMQTKINRSPSGKGEGKLTKADSGRVILPNANLGSQASSWRTLSSAAQTAWKAAAPDFPFLNKFGVPYTPSGFQLFMSVNTNLVNCGESALVTPPEPDEILNCPAFDVHGPAVPGDPMNLTITVPTGYVLVLYASSNQSAGRSYEAGRMKAVKILPAAVYASLDISADYQAVFGSINATFNIWFTGKITKADAGRQGAPFTILNAV